MPIRYPRLLRLSLLLALALGVPLAPAQGGLAQAPQERLEKARQLFQQGQEAYRQGKLEQALESFRAAEKLVPSAELAYNIGHLYDRLGVREKAVIYLRLYLSRSRGEVADGKQVLERIASLRLQLRAGRENPLGPPPQLGAQARVWFEKGARMFEQKRYREALAAWLKARELSPAPDTLYNLALASEKLGRDADALEYYLAYARALRGPEELEAVEGKIRELEARVQAATPSP